MTDLFSTAVDRLFETPSLVFRVDYQSTEAGVFALNIPSLTRSLDTEGDFGAVRVAHDIRQFEIRVKDLDPLFVEPARNDVIRPAGVPDGDKWIVQSKPTKDQLGLVWVMDVYKAAASAS